MTDPPLDNPDDRVIAEILADAEARGDAAILDGIARHPHLAARLVELRALQRSIRSARPGDALAPGEQVGDFRILRRVGAGGMGEVYEAEQVSLGRRKVALKVMRHDRATEAMRERFRREQTILARLHQTHIVPVHVAGEDRGLHYLVMPFIDGAALHDVLAGIRRQPPGSSPSLTTLIEEAVRQRACPRGSDADSPPSGEPPRLAHGYFRLVAAMMADVAEAVEAVHQAGFLHRDLKPGNLMVDRQGKVWIIDFGLACEVAEVATPTASAERLADAPPRAMSGVAGTPEYMAPEQREGRADPRSDVWGIGGTLYELLSLRRPLDGTSPAELFEQARCREGGPGLLPLRDVPGDLAAICKRALSMSPAERYQTAGELADDLKRWLAGQPTRALGASIVRQSALWAKRNKGWAVAMMLGSLLFLASVIALLWSAHVETSNALERANMAEQRERERRRESLRQQLLQIRLTTHFIDWSSRAWRLVEEAAQLPGEDDLRDQAAATLLGIDACSEKRFAGISASSVAFDDSGRLLMGGLHDTPAHLWEGGNAQPRAIGPKGPGPVAFTRAGTPIQLIVDDKDRTAVLVYDLERQRQLHRLHAPKGVVVGGPSPTCCLTPDGSFAAIATSVKGKGAVTVWDTHAGRLRRDLSTNMIVSAVALTPDGSMAAAGEEDGQVTVWSVHTGDELAKFRTGGTRVNCLAFHTNVRRIHRSHHEQRKPSWVLASGNAGGGAAVWDLAARVARMHFPGSPHGVFSVAFSPDNMTLATSGRYEVRLWDIATGRLLWIAPRVDQVFGLAFSKDGRWLACANQERTQGTGRRDACVWKMQPGRGMQSLRGLVNQISKVAISADWRWLAAMSHDWEVGVWNLESGQLRHVLDAPKGVFADNASLAFNLDGDRLAFAAGEKAIEWDLTAGAYTQQWPLPRGYVDQITYESRNRLLLPTVRSCSGAVWGIRF